eukprot:gnl/Spiro4/11738_TR6196_c0_g1_i1.p1 gnl/Spiro4/11738_TR6196_c0_g1~~gnl/Spiro4/11738_TR6196_c0_g1_i1.p1  ORF type:complete len:353 (+),score=89.08 gnl/Spiro4/11738_TR6196_c0_g1_i1:188-1246(+)
MTGRLVILSKKSWNVWNEDNIKRVKDDERKLAEVEAGKRRRSELADKEARMTALKTVKRSKRGQEAELLAQRTPLAECHVPAEEESASQSRHINFFPEAERALSRGFSGPNPEREAERKAELDKWDRDNGITSYLGAGSAETAKVKPWYHHPAEVPMTTMKQKKDSKNKDLFDPLKSLNKMVGEQKIREKKEKVLKTQQLASGSDIERLRQERLDRETHERQRLEGMNKAGYHSGFQRAPVAKTTRFSARPGPSTASVDPQQPQYSIESALRIPLPDGGGGGSGAGGPHASPRLSSSVTPGPCTLVALLEARKRARKRGSGASSSSSSPERKKRKKRKHKERKHKKKKQEEP